MVQAVDDAGEQLRHVGLDEPLLVQQIVAVADGVRADDAVEDPFLVCLVERLDRVGVEERQADHADDLLGAEPLELAHGDQHGAARGDHIVGHEHGLALHVAEQVDALDVRVGGVRADLRVVAGLVQHGQRAVQRLGVELVAGDRAGIRGHDDEVRIVEVDELVQRDQRLVRAVQVLQAQVAEAVLDLAAVDVQRDDAVDVQHLAHMAEHAGGQGLAAGLLVLAGIGERRQDQGDGVRAGEMHRVDRGEQEHQVVVHGKLDRNVAAGDLDRLLVGHVVDDVDAQSAHGVEQLGLLLAVGEAGVLHLDREVRHEERRRAFGLGNAFPVQVIEQGDDLQDVGLAHVMAFAERRRELLVAFHIQTTQVLHHFAGEILASRTGNDPELMGLHDTHVVLPRAESAPS